MSSQQTSLNQDVLVENKEPRDIGRDVDLDIGRDIGRDIGHNNDQEIDQTTNKNRNENKHGRSKKSKNNKRKKISIEEYSDIISEYVLEDLFFKINMFNFYIIQIYMFTLIFRVIIIIFELLGGYIF